MRNPFTLRNRVPSESMVAATGLLAFMTDDIGVPTPESILSFQVSFGGPYNFHPGDLFTPGTQNWVRDPDHDTSLMTMWGHGFLCRPNAFKVLQPPQVYIPVAVPVYALPGIVVGQFEQENLLMAQTGG